MRPDEFARVNAYRWTDAVVVRRAYEEGQADAAAEKAGHDEAVKMAPVA